MSEYKYTIARHVNGVTLNPLEYLLDEDDEPERFLDEAGALQFLIENQMDPEDYVIQQDPLTYDLIEDRTWDKEHNGQVIHHFTGTENECFEWIHKNTSFSFDMALKHQGYSLKPHEPLPATTPNNTLTPHPESTCDGCE